MNKDNHRGLKSDPDESEETGRSSGRDTTEQTADEKSDSRGGASPQQRGQITRSPSTSTDARDSDNGDAVLACPECNTTGIRSMVHNGYGVGAEHDHDYYCRDCGHSFDEPTDTTDLTCIVDRCGAMVAPEDALETTELFNATVTTVDGAEWIHSDTVRNLQEVR
jgi:DNA-directed RNA polymerase subunit RPC12/RpoP